MFDSPQCIRPFNAVPLAFDWGFWNWLKMPLIAGLTIAIVLGLAWCIRYLGNRRHRRLLLGGLGLLVSLLLMAERGLTLFLPDDPGTPVDAIVILGRGSDWRTSRVDLATQLWQAKRAPLVFVSGINDTAPTLELLKQRQIPAIALDGENCSLTTAENALFTGAILKARGLQRIILITDSAHLWRSTLDFQSQGFQPVIPIATSFPSTMSWGDQRILIAREYFFLITAGLNQLVSGQRISEWNSPKSENLVKLAQTYGQSKGAPALPSGDRSAL